MRTVPFGLMLLVLAASGQEREARESRGETQYRHLYTFGTRDGIHPPKVLNRKAANTAFGRGEFPWGIGSPQSVVTDRQGRVWISDSGTGSVHVFDPEPGTYREIRRVGEATLQSPSGMIADAVGRIYLADAATGGVYVFDETGEFDRTLIPRRAGRLLETPVSLALSADGSALFVLDAGKQCVVTLNREGEQTAFFHLPREMHQPVWLSVIRTQVDVLGSFPNLVEEFSPAGKLRGETRWDDIRVPGPFVCDERLSGCAVVDAGHMVVRIYDEAGHPVTSFGQRGDGLDQMQRVDAIHVDAKGRVYLADALHGRVLVFGKGNR